MRRSLRHTKRDRVTSKSCRYGVRELAPAFLGGQPAARPERAREQARGKRQRAAALQIRRDRHDPVILKLRDFDVPLPIGMASLIPKIS